MEILPRNNPVYSIKSKIICPISKEPIDQYNKIAAKSSKGNIYMYDVRYLFCHMNKKQGSFTDYSCQDVYEINQLKKINEMNELSMCIESMNHNDASENDTKMPNLNNLDEYLESLNINIQTNDPDQHFNPLEVLNKCEDKKNKNIYSFNEPKTYGNDGVVISDSDLNELNTYINNGVIISGNPEHSNFNPKFNVGGRKEELKNDMIAISYPDYDVSKSKCENNTKDDPKETKEFKETKPLLSDSQTSEQHLMELILEENIQQLSNIIDIYPTNVRKLCLPCMQHISLHWGEYSVNTNPKNQNSNNQIKLKGLQDSINNSKYDSKHDLDNETKSDFGVSTKLRKEYIEKLSFILEMNPENVNNICHNCIKIVSIYSGETKKHNRKKEKLQEIPKTN